MSDAEGWIRERFPDAPPELLDCMSHAVSTHPGALADALARGALELYARVARGSGGREDALPLLAADALLTHAFEALAEAELDGVETAAVEWGPAALQRLAP